MGEVDVEGGVFDAEREGVVDHLDLESLLGRRGGEGGAILDRLGGGAGGEEKKSYAEGTEEGQRAQRGNEKKDLVNVKRREKA